MSKEDDIIGKVAYGIFKFGIDVVKAARNPRYCQHFNLPNIADDADGFLYDESLGLGNLILGGQGRGKTAYIAGHRVDYDARHPNDASWSLDKSGDFTNKYLQAAMVRPEWPLLRKRIRYIRLGDPLFATPLPMFSPLYGNSYEDQVQRVKEIFKKLAGEAIQRNPTMYGAMYEGLLPHILRLVTSMAYVRPVKEPFQITEAMYFVNSLSLMRRAVNRLGNSLDNITKETLDNQFLNLASSRDAYERAYSMTPIFSDIGVTAGLSHLGADRPTIIPAEVNRKGWIVLVDGSRMTAHESLMNILISHIYSLIMEDVNTRIPHHYPNKVSLIIDEARKFTKIPALADDLGEISQLYRSRGVQFYMLLQSPRGQLDEGLWKNIWSMGNMVCFGLINKEDCIDVALQLTRYNSRQVKQPALTSTQNPTTEPLQGQDREMADKLNSLPRREMVMRRNYDEARPDQWIRHVLQTKHIPMLEDMKQLEDLKDELLRENALPVNEVLGRVQARLKELDPTPQAPSAVNK